MKKHHVEKKKEVKRDLRREAGERLLQFLSDTSTIDHDASDYEDSDIRELKQAYAFGYNDCRSEMMRQVADIVLEEHGERCCSDDDEDDDDYLEDDEDDE